MLERRRNNDQLDASVGAVGVLVRCCSSTFRNSNPRTETFKALAGTVKSGLVAFVSADGIKWNKLRPEPVVTYTKEYAFDSQNVAFWSEADGCYVCYFRHFLDKTLRSVCRTTSADFVAWSQPVPLKPNFRRLPVRRFA